MAKSIITVCLWLSFLQVAAQSQHAVADTLLIYDQAVLQGNKPRSSQDRGEGINRQQLFLAQLSVQDTLLWIQMSYDSWHYLYDTIIICQGDDEQISLFWKCRKVGGKVDEFWEKRQVLSRAGLAQLIEIENKFRYPKGFSNTKIESCDGCRGVQSLHYLYFKNYVKVFFEPTCSNNYWRLARKMYSR